MHSLRLQPLPLEISHCAVLVARRTTWIAHCAIIAASQSPHTDHTVYCSILVVSQPLNKNYAILSIQSLGMLHVISQVLFGFY